MTFDELTQVLQEHLSDRLVTLVGSGMSCAMGLPSMGDLAAELLVKLPSVLDDATKIKWIPVAEKLHAGLDLETSLKDSDDDTLNRHIREIVADEICAAEEVAFKRITQGSIKAPFQR